MTVEPDEMVPNCVTCRQHFEDYGHVLMLWAKDDYGPFDEIQFSTRMAAIRSKVAQHMQAFHEEHLPDDN